MSWTPTEIHVAWVPSAAQMGEGLSERWAWAMQISRHGLVMISGAVMRQHRRSGAVVFLCSIVNNIPRILVMLMHKKKKKQESQHHLIVWIEIGKKYNSYYHVRM